MANEVTAAASGIFQAGGGNFLHQFWTIMLIILGTVVAAVAVAIVVFVFVYRYKVIIKRADGSRYKKKARKIRIAGIYQLRLWRPKRVLVPGDNLGVIVKSIFTRNSPENSKPLEVSAKFGKFYYYFEDRYGQLWPYFWSNLQTSLEKNPEYAYQPLVKMMTQHTEKELQSLGRKSLDWAQIIGVASVILVALIGAISLYLSTQALAKVQSAGAGQTEQLLQISQTQSNNSVMNYQSVLELSKILDKLKGVNQTSFSGLVPVSSGGT